MDLKSIYLDRRKRFQEDSKRLQKKYNYYAYVRLLSFLLAVLGVALLFTVHILAGFAAALVFLIAFSRFVQWHLKIQFERNHAQHLETVNEGELKALEGDLSAFDAGETYLDPSHPNSIDLDLFGEHSLFQHMNRTSTSIGHACLANFISSRAEIEAIKTRQNALSDLKDKLDWRQDFQAYGLGTEDAAEHIRALKIWLEEEDFVRNNSGFKLALYLIPIWGLLAIVAMILWIPWQLGILAFLIPLWIIRKTNARVSRTHTMTANADKILKRYSFLIKHIENSEFDSTHLKNLKNGFIIENKMASKSLKRLSYIIRQLNVRFNAFAFILNLLGLWDLSWVRKLEIWKSEQKKHLPIWFDLLAEFDALVSMGGFYYNHSDFVFPVVEKTEQPLLKAEELGHPLIKAESRICNDFELPSLSHIKLVTGSNMGGKSTFLRTVGLAISMAQSGLPVCAKSLQVYPLKVYTSMRTQDALHESTSSFYAELKRLKVIIDAVEEEGHVFFLLDEILKGTNSTDRHAGAKALIHQLLQGKGVGLIATHDLELGQLEEKHSEKLENVCFEVAVDGDELFFDYKLKKGISKSFNATQLMRSMGIKI